MTEKKSHRLLLVRHGRTAPNAEQRYISTSDHPLDEVGIRQATVLGDTLAPIGVDHILSSPRQRCIETAEIIRAHVGAAPTVDVTVDERLVEVGMGEFEGLSYPEIVAAGLLNIFLSWRQGENPQYPNGAERFGDAAERAISLFAEVSRMRRSTILVGHSHILRILLAVSVLGVDPDRHRRLKLDHGHFAVVEWEGTTPRLAAMNVPAGHRAAL